MGYKQKPIMGVVHTQAQSKRSMRCHVALGYTCHQEMTGTWMSVAKGQRDALALF